MFSPSGISELISEFGVEKSEKFEARWLRILACTGAKNDSALARILDILPQSVTAARKRAQIPTGWIETFPNSMGYRPTGFFSVVAPCTSGQT